MCKDNNETPYVNLGFWGPFGDRIFQRMLTVMWVCMADGSKMRQKFNGPYGITQWLVCWAVYACGMVMHKLATREAMDDYRDFIQKLALVWGDKCWAIIYQAECRMRRSGLNYIFRQADYLLDEVVELEAKGETVYVPRNPREFNTKMPWDYCYRKCIRMECPYAANYWKVNVEQPCNFVMNRNDKVSDHVDGDCPIVNYPDEHIATGNGPTTGFSNGPRVPKQPQVPKGPPNAPFVPAKIEDPNGKAKQDKSGFYTHNKKGNQICKLFNQKGCKNPCPHKQVHQCSRCLLNSHSAYSNKCGPQAKKGKKA